LKTSSRTTSGSTSFRQYRFTVETNLFGFVYATQATFRILRQQGDGHVIQISPAGSRVNYGSFSAHQISKQAVELFSVEFARDVAPLGIKVTIVETGDTTGTEMLRAAESRVLDVAIACGFKTQQHFARVFRELCGTSPTEYRGLFRFAAWSRRPRPTFKNPGGRCE